MHFLFLLLAELGPESLPATSVAVAIPILPSVVVVVRGVVVVVPKNHSRRIDLIRRARWALAA